MSVLDQARAAKEAAREMLLAIPGVHAVGVGPKRVGGQATSEPAVVIFVVKKKPLSEIPAHERIPAEINGVKTDVLEGAMPVPHLDPIDQSDVNDDSEYEPLQGGIQIQVGVANYVGTMGCIGTFPDEPDARVVGLTNWHVVATPLGLSTTLRASVTAINATYAVDFLSLDEDGNSTPLITPRGSVVFLTLRVGPNAFDFFVQTAPNDTPAIVARKLRDEINAVSHPNFNATSNGARTLVSPAGGAVIGINPQRDIFAGGPTVTDTSASIGIKVVGGLITLTGSVEDEFYGIFTTVNASGAQQPSRGVFTRLEKHQSLTSVAAAIVQDLAANGVTAAAAGPTVTVAGVDQLECYAWKDTRVGQDDNGFSSSCCSDRIGRVIGARFGLDAAIVQLDPKLKYIADIKGIGHLTGARALTDADVMASLQLHKRGRTTGLRRGNLLTIDTDGVIAPNVSSDASKGRFSVRRYVDAITIQATGTDPRFSLGGDSGSAVVHVNGNVRDVVGLHFGGPPEGSTGPSFESPIMPILAAFNIIIKPATADNQVQTVPDLQGAAPAALIPPNRTLGSARRRLREVAGEIEATARGRRYVEMVRRHAPEAAGLVNRNRRVGVAWQRQGGPLLMRAVIDCLQAPDRALPREVAGRPVDHCIRAIAAELRAHGSPAFVSDLDQFMSAIDSVGGKTYAELLGLMQISGSQRESAPTTLSITE
jgi:hypothetical protein